jgi:hypothetical protein
MSPVTFALIVVLRAFVTANGVPSIAVKDSKSDVSE